MEDMYLGAHVNALRKGRIERDIICRDKSDR